MKVNISELWDNSLKLNEDKDLQETVIREYCEYFNCSKDEAKKLIFDTNHNSEALTKWYKNNHEQKQKKIHEIFGEDRTFIQGNLRACANRMDAEERIFVVEFMKLHKCNSVLEFGGAFGTTALLYTSNGIKDVWLADISDNQMKFAKWRADRRKMKLSTLNLNDKTKKLPTNYFDMVTAFQCFEQIENPTEAINRIRKSLKVGGYFSIYVHYLKANPERPWNISPFPYFLFKLRSSFGFSQVYWKDYGNKIHVIYKKEKRMRFNFFYFVIDFIRCARRVNKVKRS